VILYYFAELSLEFTSFALLDFFCSLILQIRLILARPFPWKAFANFHSPVNISLLFFFYSSYK
jgi:hypothetical protein